MNKQKIFAIMSLILIATVATLGRQAGSKQAEPLNAAPSASSLPNHFRAEDLKVVNAKPQVTREDYHPSLDVDLECLTNGDCSEQDEVGHSNDPRGAFYAAENRVSEHLDQWLKKTDLASNSSSAQDLAMRALRSESEAVKDVALRLLEAALQSRALTLSETDHVLRSFEAVTSGRLMVQLLHFGERQCQLASTPEHLEKWTQFITQQIEFGPHYAAQDLAANLRAFVTSENALSFERLRLTLPKQSRKYALLSAVLSDLAQD